MISISKMARLSLTALILAQCGSVFATSLDEIYGPLLDKGQLEGALTFDLDRYRTDFNYYQILGATTITYDYDYSYLKPAFGINLAYGASSFLELKLGLRYSMNYGYDYQAINWQNIGGVRATDVWRDVAQDFKYPFHITSAIDIRPSQSLDIKVYYDLDIYKSITRYDYGATVTTHSLDTILAGMSRFQTGKVELTWLYKPEEKYTYIKSDIDGILRPLIEAGQVKLTPSYNIEDAELAYRPSETTSRYLYQEKWHKHFFSGDITLGISDSFQANANTSYYLPYRYRDKTFWAGREVFIDETYKYSSSYDIGAGIKKRYGPNAELFASGSFNTVSVSKSVDQYNSYNNLNHTVSYTGYRQDIYSTRAGIVYVSDAKKKIPKGAVTFNDIERPLLEKNQFMVNFSPEFNVRIQKASTRFIYNHYTYIMSGGLTYGLTDRLELAVNARYVFPAKYKYDEFNNLDDSITRHDAEYREEQLYLNIRAVYRTDPTTEISFNCGYDPTTELPYVILPGGGLSRRFTSFGYTTDSANSVNYIQRDIKYSHYYFAVVLKKLF